MFNQFLLLAERNPFRDMASVVRDRREHFDPLDLLPWLLVLAALFGVLAVVSRYLNRQDKRRLFNNPRALFRDLCRAHALDGADCRLLQHLAKANGIDQPASLFLDLELLQAAAASAEFQRYQTSIEALIAKLFASELPLTKVAPAAAPVPPEPPAVIATETSSNHTVASSSDTEEEAEATLPQKPASTQRREAKPGAVGEKLRDEAPTDGGPSISEQHAVRALEALMKQIHASRETQSPPASSTGNGTGRTQATGNQPRPVVIPDVSAPMNDPMTHR